VPGSNECVKEKSSGESMKNIRALPKAKIATASVCHGVDSNVDKSVRVDSST
jgi:hypothetical protein